MKVGLAGDWHGNYRWAEHVLAGMYGQGVDTIFQVGDFGIGWPGHGELYTAAVDDCLKILDQTLYVIPGNHENWDFINSLVFANHQAWIGERICVLERNARFEMDGRSFLALGGAPSIDYPQRTQGVSWWADEMLTMGDVDAAVAGGYADIMLTHDAPDNGTDAVQRIIDNPWGWSSNGLAYAAEGRELMNLAFAGVKPAFFAHGHYHVSDQKKVGVGETGTHFVSLGMDGQNGSAGILDLATMEYSWLDGA